MKIRRRFKHGRRQRAGRRGNDGMKEGKIEVVCAEEVGKQRQNGGAFRRAFGVITVSEFCLTACIYLCQ